MQDQIRIRLPGEDLGPLHRVITATMSYLDEARDSEERVPFAERLVRLQEQCQKSELTVAREDLHALYRALHVAAGHATTDLFRGADTQASFIKRLVRIRKTVIDAVGDHDDIPMKERSYG